MADDLDFSFNVQLKGAEEALAAVRKVADELTLARGRTIQLGESAAKAFRKSRVSADEFRGTVRGVRAEIEKFAATVAEKMSATRTKIKGVGRAVADVSRDFNAMAMHSGKALGTTAAGVRTVEAALKASRAGAVGFNAELSRSAKVAREVAAMSAKIKSPPSVADQLRIPTPKERTYLPPGSRGGMSSPTGGPSWSSRDANRLGIAIGDAAGKRIEKIIGSKHRDMNGASGGGGGFSGFSGASLGGLAAVAGVGASIRSGFSGTVEGHRLSTELELFNRELAAIVKPLTDLLTTKIGGARRWLERRTEGEQNLIMGGIVAGGGAIAANRVGLLGKGAGAKWGGIGRGVGAFSRVAARGAFPIAAGVQAIDMIQRHNENEDAIQLMKNIRGGKEIDPDMARNIKGRAAMVQESGKKKEWLAAHQERVKEYARKYEGRDENDQRIGGFGQAIAHGRKFLMNMGLDQAGDLERQQIIRDAPVAAALNGEGVLGGKKDHRSLLLAQAGFNAPGAMRDEMQVEFLKQEAQTDNEKELKKLQFGADNPDVKKADPADMAAFAAALREFIEFEKQKRGEGAGVQGMIVRR